MHVEESISDHAGGISDHGSPGASDSGGGESDGGGGGGGRSDGGGEGGSYRLQLAVPIGDLAGNLAADLGGERVAAQLLRLAPLGRL